MFFSEFCSLLRLSLVETKKTRSVKKDTKNPRINAVNFEKIITDINKNKIDRNKTWSLKTPNIENE